VKTVKIFSCLFLKCKLTTLRSRIPPSDSCNSVTNRVVNSPSDFSNLVFESIALNDMTSRHFTISVIKKFWNFKYRSILSLNWAREKAGRKGALIQGQPAVKGGVGAYGGGLAPAPLYACPLWGGGLMGGGSFNITSSLCNLHSTLHCITLTQNKLRLRKELKYILDSQH